MYMRATEEASGAGEATRGRSSGVRRVLRVIVPGEALQ